MAPLAQLADPRDHFRVVGHVFEHFDDHALGRQRSEESPASISRGKSQTQLLAVATGGRVEVGRDGPEVGPQLVAKKDAAWTDPLFADLPLMQDVLQFHNDAITRLPPGAELLVLPLRGTRTRRSG